uniref:Uncharacterized protein n=1 Tax=Arundo donax TaxID=35708 RepID=A0A0A9GK66_ARUDO
MVPANVKKMYDLVMGKREQKGKEQKQLRGEVDLSHSAGEGDSYVHRDDSLVKLQSLKTTSTKESSDVGPIEESVMFKSSSFEEDEMELPS